MISNFGSPQEFVLWLILFTVFISPVTNIESHGISQQHYADDNPDTQQNIELYVTPWGPMV